MKLLIVLSVLVAAGVTANAPQRFLYGLLKRLESRVNGIANQVSILQRNYRTSNRNSSALTTKPEVTTRAIESTTTDNRSNGTCRDMDWSDSDGDGCGFYAMQWYCKNGSSRYAKNGVSAMDACCVCGGGNRAASDNDSYNTTTESTWTTANPYTTRVVDDTPMPNCTDRPWSDIQGDDCGWYVRQAYCGNGYTLLTIPSRYIDPNYYDYYGFSAKDACCQCGGGNRGASENDGYDTTTSVYIPQTTRPQSGPQFGLSGSRRTTANPTSSRYLNYSRITNGTVYNDTSMVNCEDKRWWRDSSGDRCAWYVRKSYCRNGYTFKSTTTYAKYGVSAEDACCACGGGYRRNSENSGYQSSTASYRRYRPQTTRPYRWFMSGARRSRSQSNSESTTVSYAESGSNSSIESFSDIDAGEVVESALNDFFDTLG